MTDNWRLNEIPLPSGTIITWTGQLSNVPAGWLVCDGNNGTPDLRNRFVKGVPNSSTDPGATGGSNSVTVSSSQMPEHNHYLNIDNDGGHNHQMQGHGSANVVDYIALWGGSANTATSSSVDATHSHTLTTDPTGSGSSVDNQPAYYEVLFIQKP